MPHQCTTCERTFPDGSKEMLSGCPDCGGNKFQFTPSSTPPRDPDETGGNGITTENRTAASSEQDEPSGITTPSEQSPARETGSESTESSFREWPETARRPADRASAPDTDPQRTERDSSTADGDATVESQPAPPSSEDSAQASARSEIVSSDELPRSRSPDEPDDDAPSPDSGRVVSEPTDTAERPSLDQLREELNDQFESIKIVRPGQYELNLMELYDREEYIVSLQEDGRYVIDVPDSWREGNDDS
ncbi:OapC/ArvC family zinc-ribbon domain-containing protein [Natronosalvus vescus]|uniref:OapC/ArvC family zinc-ribbon domain-containing protein n=1 Tax=Natronosalvus vescus TaxID=2953881 RepID=UPI0020919F5E|nr:Zn-ribbon containing protein [Natronosalvus vescus]